MTSRQRVLASCVPLCLLLVAATGCQKEQAAAPAPVVRPVKMLTVASAVGGERSYPGRVAAASQVDMSFRVGGPLVALPTLEGQRVSRGKLLARIDPRDYEIQVESARARYEQSQADYDRMNALYERDAVSKAQLDQARATRDMSKAALDDAQANLGDTRLRAPFGGLVGEIFVENFQDVQPRERILSLIAVDQVDIEVDLPESIVARIRESDSARVKVTARFEAAPGREFDLRISELAVQANPRTQTYRATLRMQQPEGINILPGMTANVFGKVDDASVTGAGVVIPAVAVVSDNQGASFVWVVDSASMTVSRRAVETGGLSGKDGVEIVSGLEPGETIATSAVARLSEGMQVTSWDR
jgi:RND family efflux transporter MFP subunit